MKVYAVSAVFAALVLHACSDSGREPLKQTGDRPVVRANAGPATQEYRNTEPATAQKRHLSSDRRRAGNTAPNIILIVADDLGYGHLGAYGQALIKTPNLDRMAGEGMRFTRFYAGSTVCAPSRSSLMEGLHTGSAHIRGNALDGGGFFRLMNRMSRNSGPTTISDGPPAAIRPFVSWMFRWIYKSERGGVPLPGESVTIADVMKGRGYSTGIIGKWGLGVANSSGAPNRQGFGYFFGLSTHMRAQNHFPSQVWRNTQSTDTANDYFVPHHVFDGDPDDLESDQYDLGMGSEWFDDMVTREAISFIERERNNRFFLYLPYITPHAALQVPGESLAEYQGAFEEQPFVSRFLYLSRRNPRAYLAAMITRLDENIGRLLNRLDDLGLSSETLILFTSDNGPTREGGSDVDFFDANGPLRGMKRDLYEGGIRVPLIARWPGTIEAGAVNDHMAAAWDLLPTFADLAGEPYEGRTHGISMAPTLLNRGKQETHDHLYWEFHEGGGAQAVRKDRWKAVRLDAHARPDGRVELYDLDADPGEQHDIAADHPDVAAEMAAIMSRTHRPSWNDLWNFTPGNPSGDQ